MPRTGHSRFYDLEREAPDSVWLPSGSGRRQAVASNSRRVTDPIRVTGTH